MFGIGGIEFFIILLFAFLIFGPDKLPEIAKLIGAAIGKFKKAQEEMNQVIHGEVLNPDAKTPARGSNRASGRAAEEMPVEETTAVKETFAERRARYERQKAEEVKRAEIEANREKYKSEAAQKASTDSEVVAVEDTPNTEAAIQTNTSEDMAAKSGSTQDVVASSNTAEEASAVTQKRTYSAEELYGIKPVVPNKVGEER